MISVVIDEPILAHYGGVVAGPVFRRVGEASLRHLGVPSATGGAALARHSREQRRIRRALERRGVSEEEEGAVIAVRPTAPGEVDRSRSCGSQCAKRAGEPPRERTSSGLQRVRHGLLARARRRQHHRCGHARSRGSVTHCGPRGDIRTNAGPRSDVDGGDPMMLSALEKQVGDLFVERRGDVDVTDVSRDSRRVGPGGLFAALPGERRDGARFVAMARERGASAVVVEAEHASDLNLPALIVTDARKAMAHVAHAVHGEPTQKLGTIGVTGTNGKTTTTFLIEGVLRAAEKRTALLGTVTQRILDDSRSTFFTTPESDDLARFAREAADAGAERLVMEVSSHGLSLSRVRGVDFDIAAFTNLTQDHLDFHQSMEEYGETKAKLFTEFAPRVSVINIDDAFGAVLAGRVADREAAHPTELVTVSATGAAEATIRATGVRIDASGIRATLITPEGEHALRSPLVGAHNLENLLVTFAVARACGIQAPVALKALADGVSTPGRLEEVSLSAEQAEADYRVLVDYAHTPDALRNALAAVRTATTGRVLVVFGCGGDRDTDKRPLMGEAAARGADICIVTSDNPRTEEPASIVEAIIPGVERGGKRIDVDAFVSVDRREAITRALRLARPGDSVLIAGKGHEDYQVIGTERIDFDDRVVAQESFEHLSLERGQD